MHQFGTSFHLTLVSFVLTVRFVDFVYNFLKINPRAQSRDHHHLIISHSPSTVNIKNRHHLCRLSSRLDISAAPERSFEGVAN